MEGEMTEWPRVYAWTPVKPAYEHYPQYASFKVFADGRCVVTLRAPEFRTVGNDFYEMGETVCIQLPPHAAAELRDFFASVDGRRMAETENTGSVPQGTTSAVPSEASADAPPSAPSLQTPQGGDS